jgi:CheY-like chemotaxis protein
MRLSTVKASALRQRINGVEALDGVTQAPPAVVIVDLEMPIMAGLSSLRHFAPWHPRTRQRQTFLKVAVPGPTRAAVPKERE